MMNKCFTLFFVLLACLNNMVCSQKAYSQEGQAAETAEADTGLYEDLFSDVFGEEAAGADTAGPAQTAGSQASQPRHLEITGDHTAKFSLPLSEDNFDYDRQEPLFKNEFKMEYAKDDITLVSEWLVYIPLREDGLSIENSEAVAGENYIEWSPPSARLSFGYQKIYWGVADDMNPVNNVSPKNYKEYPLEVEELPVFSAICRLYPTPDWEIEGVYLPFDPPDRQFFDIESQVPDAVFGAEKAVFVEEPEFSPESSVLGVRIARFTPAVDWSVSYLFDFDSIYTPELGVASFGGFYAVETMELHRKRVHRFGFDAKKVVEPYAVWLEAAYSLTEDYGNDDDEKRNSDFFWVFGLDRNFGEMDQHYVNFQYFGKWYVNYDDSYFEDYKNGAPGPADLTDPDNAEKYYYRSLVDPFGGNISTMVHGMSFSWDWSFFRDKFSPKIDAAYQIPAGYDGDGKTYLGELFLLPEATFELQESLFLDIGSRLSWSLYLEDDEVHKEKSTMGGMLRDFNTLYLKLRYSWKSQL